MARLLWIIFALTLISLCNTANQKLGAEVKIVKNINTFRSLNPRSNLVPLYRNPPVRGKVRYTLGNRINGDRVISEGSDGYYYPTPRDVEFTLWYPESGIGDVITHVEILVDQSSNAGDAYVIAGGIGERHIRVVIEARNTLHFIWQSTFFGHP